jgi:hypothetical protein
MSGAAAAMECQHKMSIEYSTLGDAKIDDASFSLIAERISSWSEYEILDTSQHKARLKFRESERRPSWPEDVSIQVRSGKIYVEIHSGTRQQRKTLIDRLTELLGSLGISTQFEEI